MMAMRAEKMKGRTRSKVRGYSRSSQYQELAICRLAEKQYLCITMNIDAILTAILIPFAGTALGSAFVFFMKKGK